MGIDYQAAIIVGAPRGAFKDQEQLDEWINNGTVEVCSPYYDGSGDDSAICGFFINTSQVYQPVLLDYDGTAIDEAKRRFKALTSMPASVWLSPYGY